MSQPVYCWPDHVLTRSTAPATSIMTLVDAKAHLRVDTADEDDYITLLLSAVEAALDGPNGMVGRALVTQSWTLTQARITGATKLPIPVLPFQSATSLKYYDVDNAQQTETLTDYTFFANNEYGYVEPVTAWPVMYDRPDALEFIFAAGYGDVTAVPQSITQAAKLLVGHWFENREAVQVNFTPHELPMAVEMLVNLERRGWIAA